MPIIVCVSGGGDEGQDAGNHVLGLMSHLAGVGAECAALPMIAVRSLLLSFLFPSSPAPDPCPPSPTSLSSKSLLTSF